MGIRLLIAAVLLLGGWLLISAALQAIAPYAAAGLVVLVVIWFLSKGQDQPPTS